MAMTVIWVVMVGGAFVFGAATGRADAVGNAALEGATAAVTLCLSVGGMICLWSGVMEVMKRSGLLRGLSRLLRPLLSRIFPQAARDREILDAISANVSANLLGLGNAATPMGIRACEGMMKMSGKKVASNELCRLVVMNTASIQLLPTTIAGIRAAAGASSAFDILPAVWISSMLSVAAGLLSSSVLSRFSRE